MKYDKEFKLQALQLSDEIGVKAAAEQLGLKYYTLAEWRKSRTRHGDDAFVGSGHKAVPLSENEHRIRELEQKLRTDISQITCIDGTLYISPIIDCFNGDIISLYMRSNIHR